MTDAIEIERGDMLFVRFQPRETAGGQGLRAGIAAFAGTHLWVVALWRQDDDDVRYAGEWALGPVLSKDRRPGGLFGRRGPDHDGDPILWISSGDVVVIKTADAAERCWLKDMG